MKPETQAKTVALSARDLLYLQNARFLPPSLAHLVGDTIPGQDATRVLTVSRAVAEQFRASFTDRLARVGFDSQYELTEEGRLLEDLIDRFDSK